MTAPWEGPPPPDRRGIKDFIGRSVLIVIGGVRHGVQGQRGPYDVIHTTLVSLAGADAGTIYPDVHIFTSRIAGRLRAEEGGKVKLAKVVDAGKAPDLEDPDSWDQEAARSWYMNNPGLLDQLRIQAQADYRDFLTRQAQAQQQPNGGYQQPSMAAQQQYAREQYAQPQQQYAPQPQMAQPQVTYQQQPSYTTTTATMSAPPPPPVQQYGPPPGHQESLRQLGPDAPPPAPPPQYGPQQSATFASMSTPPPPPQSDEPPF